jgi:pyocin large subunit-like protein
MYFNARFMSPVIGRFVQADSIVPNGDKASIVPLTVDFHEPQFLAQLNAENRYTLEHGFWFQLSADEKREDKVQRGPLNPQALNRFSYVLGNPLKYTDPTGHIAGVDDAVIGTIVLVVGAVVVAWWAGDTYGWGPHAAENRAALASSMEALGSSIEASVQQATNSINAMFAKKRDIQEVERLLDKYGITDKAIRRKLHDEITRQGLTLEEIEAEIAEIARRLREKLNQQDQTDDSGDDDE